MGEAHAVILERLISSWCGHLASCHAHVLQNVIMLLIGFLTHAQTQLKALPPSTLFQLLILDANMFALAAIAQN